MQEEDWVLEGNPGKKERIQALLAGQEIRVKLLEEAGRIRYIRLNENQQLEYSLTGREHTFSVYEHPYDYSPVLRETTDQGIPKRIEILDKIE